MIYDGAEDWREARSKRIMLFGMSGLGKTYMSNLLRQSGGWFHYSVDYRIGTRYLGEHIVDNFKRVAMRQPFLRELLLSDSIYIASNITFDNLAPLSTWLGKPGDPDRGGLDFEEYLRRQALHREAEIAATLDTVRFVDRAEDLYGYTNFVCDTSGSICEIVEPENPDDPILSALAPHVLPVHIEGTEEHIEKMVRRFDRAPKPMYYRPDVLHRDWEAYLRETGLAPDRVDPDAFVRWTYRRALDRRAPIYRAIACNWGVTIPVSELAAASDAAACTELVARALEARCRGG
jgi:hypothetical protein